MNTAIAARIAAGVTSAYVRDLTRHPAPAPVDGRRDEPNHRREHGHASALDGGGRRRVRPGSDRSPRRDGRQLLRISSDEARRA
jgi:hypothetical protein